jgi:iron complex transport system permease protein
VTATVPLIPSSVVRTARRVRRARLRRTVAALSAAVVVLFLVDVLLGSYTVTMVDLVRILGGADLPGATFIVLENKLPRAVVGLLVGVSFGISGALFQTLLRNPLASPDVIGVTAGASTAAVVAIVVGVTGRAVSWWAIGGACAVAALVHLVARRGALSGQRLVLAGVGVAAMLQAVTSYLLTRSDLRTAAEVLIWLNGSLNNSTWDRVLHLLVALLVLVPATVCLARGLRVLELGPPAAAALGVPVDRTRLALLFTAVVLSAVATAAAGPVAFVAFLSGPIARRLLRGTTSLVAAGLVGAVVVLSAEFVATNLVAGVSLPVGVVTGALGAPFLLYLLATAHRVGRGG